LKKPNRTETEKNPEKNQAKLEKKPSPTGKKTEPNRFEPVCLKKTKPNRNRLVWTGFAFFKKKIISVWFFFFLIKTELNRKWSPLTYIYIYIYIYIALYCKNVHTKNKTYKGKKEKTALKVMIEVREGELEIVKNNLKNTWWN